MGLGLTAYHLFDNSLIQNSTSLFILVFLTFFKEKIAILRSLESFLKYSFENVLF